MLAWKEALRQDMLEKYSKMSDKDLKKELEVDMRMLKMIPKMPEESARDINKKHRKLLQLHEKYNHSDGFQIFKKDSHRLYQRRADSYYIEIFNQLQQRLSHFGLYSLHSAVDR